ncbi:MAG TPA: vanadium-dependent haloperoxidase [Bryobacteraceae bacterium]|nr:vanadium-dependent haloperoxidase [Bryobacteraceae bacterium]
MRWQIRYISSALALACIMNAESITRRGAHKPNLVVQWNNAALQGVRDSKLGPPMVARALAIVHTCIYDAWAAYDERAIGTRPAAVPPHQFQHRRREEGAVEEAISYAAYRAAVDLFAGDKDKVFDPLMQALGYDPANTTTDTREPAGVGNVACAAVLDYRHKDGSNQLGDMTPAGVPYSDYTDYVPLNPPATVPVDPSLVKDINHWQPLQYLDATGATVVQKYVGPHWGLVKPFALHSGQQFRTLIAHPGPAFYGSAEFLQQAEELISQSAGLSDEQKMIAEYWADGPNSELPPGHWDLFAQFVSARDHHTLEQDVKIFFALTNAIFDASIVAWDAKREYDSVRPATALPYLFQGQPIQCWGGPGKGTITTDGKNWTPYQRSTFPTPPFPEYISGHSTFSAAGARVLEALTGSSYFGASVTFAPGSSKIEPGFTPAQPVTLMWGTFKQAADEAGVSRRYGGIHFRTADLAGRFVGRLVADKALETSQALWEGRRRREPED